MGYTDIQWTDRSENPIGIEDSTGNYCQKISPACEYCYAEVMARRLAGISKKPFFPYKHLAEPPNMELRRHVIKSWGRRRKPSKNFVCSMTDLFLDIIPDEWIFEVFDGMMWAPLQTFQILTKRPKRMYELTEAWLRHNKLSQMPLNMWFGVTTENQKYYEERTEWLCQIRCAIRFISCEPLLGPIDLTEGSLGQFLFTPITGIADCPEIPKGYHGRIHWVITGGESGSKKNVRLSHPDWFRSLRDQCKEYKAAFFFKQWGAYRPRLKGEDDKKLRAIAPDGKMLANAVEIMTTKDAAVMKRVGAKAAGNILDGKQHLYFPKYQP